MPPTTPPAIAPVFELPLEDDGTGAAVLGVIVDWLARVELGTIEALPVTSGESVTEPRINKRCGSLAKTRTAGSLSYCCIPVIGLQGK